MMNLPPGRHARYGPRAAGGKEPGRVSTSVMHVPRSCRWLRGTRRALHATAVGSIQPMDNTVERKIWSNWIRCCRSQRAAMRATWIFLFTGVAAAAYATSAIAAAPENLRNKSFTISWSEEHNESRDGGPFREV